MASGENQKSGGSTLLRWIGRLVVMAIVLAVVSFLTPGFSISGLWSYIIAALVISILDFLVEFVLKIDAAPFVKGIKGFVIAVIIIYVAQFVVPNMSVSIIGAIIAALIIGILDAVFPTRIM